MKIFFTVLWVFAICYIALLVFAFFFAEKMIFPMPYPSYTKKDNGIFFIPTSDNGKIAALWLPAKDCDFCLIYCHGNGEDIGRIRSRLEMINRAGISVLAYDYNGYGLSSGKANVKNFENAAVEVFDYANKVLKYPTEKISVMGYSLGGAAACTIADARSGLRSVVLLSAFSKAINAILPFDPLPWDILANCKKIAKFKMPILMIHGTRDYIVPIRNAYTNYKAAKSPTHLLVYEGDSHYIDRQDAWAEIIKFIKNPQNEKSTCDIIR